MFLASILNDLKFNEDKPAISLLIETDSSKEIRILFRKAQEMREHKAPYPIAVEIFRGEIEFKVKESSYLLKEGMIITLEANVPHSLRAIEESIIRLTLNKLDRVERVESVAK
jgi:quercetin dioxygenase-like cupin family protein